MRHFTGMFGMRRKISFKIFYNFFMLKSIKNKLKEKSSKKKQKMTTFLPWWILLLKMVALGKSLFCQKVDNGSF